MSFILNTHHLSLLIHTLKLRTILEQTCLQPSVGLFQDTMQSEHYSIILSPLQLWSLIMPNLIPSFYQRYMPAPGSAPLDLQSTSGPELQGILIRFYGTG